MKLKFVYKILPVVIFYTNKFIGKNSIGRNYGPIVVIRPEEKNNPILERHELEHAKQCYRTLCFHSLRYHTDDRYKLRMEIEAFLTEYSNRYSKLENGLWIRDKEPYLKPNSYELQLLVHRLHVSYNLDLARLEIKHTVEKMVEDTFK